MALVWAYPRGFVGERVPVVGTEHVAPLQRPDDEAEGGDLSFGVLCQCVTHSHTIQNGDAKGGFLQKLTLMS